jgi:AcrR family transcriptional regulator
MAETSPAEGVRALAREQMRAAILDTARSHLAEHGAVGLSLRAVARDVGMVSSALYRYFDSRDALLTALIVDAYNSLGDAVEAADADVPRDDLTGRFNAFAVTTRRWAMDDPHQYALVYGSPVPGYAAPPDTIGPATRVTGVLGRLLVDIAASHPHGGTGPAASGGTGAAAPTTEPDAALAAAMAPVSSFLGDNVPTDLLIRGVMAWTYVFGAVSFELFGQHHNVIADDLRDEFFAEEIRRIAELIGIA